MHLPGWQDALARFRYLHLGLAAILGYVPPVSLAVVVGAPSLAALASYVVARAQFRTAS